MEGGPPSFRRDCSCPAVLTVPSPRSAGVAYGTLTRSGRPFQQRSAAGQLAHSVGRLPPPAPGRSTPTCQRRQALTTGRFRLLPARSPLRGESSLFVRVLRCFSSPTAPPAPIVSVPGPRVSPRGGCPIRRPSDHRLPAAPRGVSSPGHVLHRPPPPRHPPSAHLAELTPPPRPLSPGPRRRARSLRADARCHHSLVKVPRPRVAPRTGPRTATGHLRRRQPLPTEA